LYRAHRSHSQQTTDIDIALKVVAIGENRRKNAKPPGAIVSTAVVVVVVVGMLELIVVIPACNTYVFV